MRIQTFKKPEVRPIYVSKAMLPFLCTHPSGHGLQPLGDRQPWASMGGNQNPKGPRMEGRGHHIQKNSKINNESE